MSALGATHSSLYDHVRGIVVGFVGFPDSIASYGCVSRECREYIHRKGIPNQAISIPNHLVNKVFENIHKFPALERLEMSGPSYFPPKLEMKNGTGRINHLVFKTGSAVTEIAPPLLEFFQAIPHLRGLSLNEMPDVKNESLASTKRVGGWDWTPYEFQLIGWDWELCPVEHCERQGLRHLEKNHLSQLTELNLIESGMNHDSIHEIIKRSTNFRSVNLFHVWCSNQIYRALMQSRNLLHLHFGAISDHAAAYGRGEKLDGALLAECHSLQSFRSDRYMTEEALIAIVQSNRGLTHLDLSPCRFEILTDEVLQVVKLCLPGLLSLSILVSGAFTSAGFTSFLQGCTHLRSLFLEREVGISAETIVLLKESVELKELSIEHCLLSDEVVDALTTLKKLTSLNLIDVREATPDRLLKIQALLALKSLTVNGVKRL